MTALRILTDKMHQTSAMKSTPAILPTRSWVVVGGLCAVAGALFAAGIWRDLPYISHGDEPTNLLVVQRMLDERSVNPQLFYYPSLLYYVQAIAQLPFEAIDSGPWVERVVFGSAFSDESVRIVAARLLSVAFGVCVVGLVYWIAARVTGRRAVGLIAGAFTLASPIVVVNARLVTPDIYATLFVTIALGASIEVARERHGTTAYIVAGVAVGLAAGTKYNTVFVAVALTIAHLFRTDRRELRNLFLAAFSSIGAFLVSTPFSLLDFEAFRYQSRVVVYHYQNNPGATEGSSLGFHLERLFMAHGLILLFVVVALAARQWRRELAVLLGFSASYLALTSTYPRHFERTLVVVIPALMIAAALGVAEAAKRANVSLRVIAAVLVALLAWPLAAALSRTDNGDHTAQAREWFAALEPGPRIGVDWYAPWIDPATHDVSALDEDVELRASRLDEYDLLVVPERAIERKGVSEEWEAYYDRLIAKLEVIATLPTADGPVYVLTTS